MSAYMIGKNFINEQQKDIKSQAHPKGGTFCLIVITKTLHSTAYNK